MVKWYYSTSGEERLGPVQLEVLQQLWAKGELGRDSLVWRKGFQDWLPVSAVEGMERQLGIQNTEVKAGVDNVVGPSDGVNTPEQPLPRPIAPSSSVKRAKSRQRLSVDDVETATDGMQVKDSMSAPSASASAVESTPALDPNSRADLSSAAKSATKSAHTTGHGWVVKSAKDGRIFYYNFKTKEKTWNKPQEIIDDEKAAKSNDTLDQSITLQTDGGEGISVPAVDQALSVATQDREEEACNDVLTALPVSKLLDTTLPSPPLPAPASISTFNEKATDPFPDQLRQDNSNTGMTGRPYKTEDLMEQMAQPGAGAGALVDALLTGTLTTASDLAVLAAAQVKAHMLQAQYHQTEAKFWQSLADCLRAKPGGEASWLRSVEAVAALHSQGDSSSRQIAASSDKSSNEPIEAGEVDASAKQAKKPTQIVVNQASSAPEGKTLASARRTKSMGVFQSTPKTQSSPKNKVQAAPRAQSADEVSSRNFAMEWADDGSFGAVRSQGDGSLKRASLNSLIYLCGTMTANAWDTAIIFARYWAPEGVDGCQVLLSKCLSITCLADSGQVKSSASDDAKDIVMRVMGMLEYWAELVPSDWTELLADGSETLSRLEKSIEMVTSLRIRRKLQSVKIAVSRSIQSRQAAFQASVDTDKLDLPDVKDSTVAASGKFKRRGSRAHASAESMADFLNTSSPAASPSSSTMSMPASPLTMTVLDFTEAQLALAITAVDYGLLLRVKPSEMLGQAWNKNGKDKNSPNLVRCIRWFNRVSRWASSEIVNGQTVKDRARILKRLILTAEECLEQGNVSSCLAIISGLNAASIHRLRATWDGIPEKIKAKFDRMFELTSSASNYKDLRAWMEQRSAPFLPFLGMLLTDLTFLEDANKGGDGEQSAHTFNYSVCSQEAKIIANVLKAQQSPRAVPDQKLIIDYLFGFFVLSEDECYRRSLQYEERKA